MKWKPLGSVPTIFTPCLVCRSKRPTARIPRITTMMAAGSLGMNFDSANIAASAITPTRTVTPFQSPTWPMVLTSTTTVSPVGLW